MFFTGVFRKKHKITKNTMTHLDGNAYDRKHDNRTYQIVLIVLIPKSFEKKTIITMGSGILKMTAATTFIPITLKIEYLRTNNASKYECTRIRLFYSTLYIVLRE